MINGVGNFLAFTDNNVSSNNNFEIINDNSFAEMLNKLQKEDIYSEASANKIVDREDYKNYDNVENNNDDFQKYLETMENDKVEEFNNDLENQNDNRIKNNKEENTEDKIDNKNLENSLEDKKTENIEKN